MTSMIEHYIEWWINYKILVIKFWLKMWLTTVVEIMENLAYLANASNLVLYLTEYMHLSPSGSANAVTNFMGTAFLLALLGGFFSDAFFTTYQIYLISALIQFLVILFFFFFFFFFFTLDACFLVARYIVSIQITN